MIEVKEVEIEEALKVHKNVLEFDNLNPQKNFFENRYKDKEKLIIVTYYNSIPIGYIVGYDKTEENNSFYCWMAGVDINLFQLLQYFFTNINIMHNSTRSFFILCIKYYFFNYIYI